MQDIFYICYKEAMKKIKKSGFSKRLADIRRKKGFSQRDLAKVTGISQRMIAHYETKADTIPVEKMAVIAKALKVSLDELVGIKELKEITPVKQNTRILKKLEKIEELPKKDQKALLHFLDALLVKSKAK
jgi:transcriptional regulator with XRE-family HTH domain